jgi:hypothetical protein
VTDKGLHVWRYATATGRPREDRLLPEGWVIER